MQIINKLIIKIKVNIVSFYNNINNLEHNILRRHIKDNLDKVFPVMALFFLILTMLFVLFQNDKAAEQSAIWVYYFLCLTVVYHVCESIYLKYKNIISLDTASLEKTSKYKNYIISILKKYIPIIYLVIKNYKYSFILFVTFIISIPWFLSSGYLFFIDFSWGPTLILDYSCFIYLGMCLVRILYKKYL
jgi:hypothetical protein